MDLDLMIVEYNRINNSLSTVVEFAMSTNMLLKKNLWNQMWQLQRIFILWFQEQKNFSLLQKKRGEKLKEELFEN